MNEHCCQLVEILAAKHKIGWTKMEEAGGICGRFGSKIRRKVAEKNVGKQLLEKLKIKI
jgi:hypothetical protein